MKKFTVIAIVAGAVLTMFSCGVKSEKVPFDNGDSSAVANADPTIYGVCGEETSMNTLQLITDMGDTLSLDMSVAQENGRVLGGIQVGDRMAVLPDADRTAAVQVINQATLLGNWVMPNPLDGAYEVGISIKEGGVVEGISQNGITYKTWRLPRGKLEIVLVREGGSEEDEVYLYDILKLGADSLVYKLVPSATATEELDLFEYTRQKPKESKESEIRLEDSQKDFFM